MRLFTIAIVLLSSFQLCGQQLVRGIVVDSASFAALPYVSVQVKNTIRGTSSDAKGNFSIVASETDTLVFTLIGYNRLEFPLLGYEPGMIRLTEKTTILAPVVIRDSLFSDNPYEGMFDEQNENLKKRVPFYYHKKRKDKVKAAYWKEDVIRVQTYVDVIINDPTTKKTLMQKYLLDEKHYYEILTAFNEKYYSVMYYLTTAELTSLLNRFFESEISKR